MSPLLYHLSYTATTENLTGWRSGVKRERCDDWDQGAGTRVTPGRRCATPRHKRGGHNGSGWYDAGYPIARNRQRAGQIKGFIRLRRAYQTLFEPVGIPTFHTWAYGHIPLIPRLTAPSRSQCSSPEAVFTQPNTERERYGTNVPLPHFSSSPLLSLPSRERLSDRHTTGSLLHPFLPVSLYR